MKRTDNLIAWLITYIMMALQKNLVLTCIFFPLQVSTLYDNKLLHAVGKSWLFSLFVVSIESFHFDGCDPALGRSVGQGPWCYSAGRYNREHTVLSSRKWIITDTLAIWCTCRYYVTVVLLAHIMLRCAPITISIYDVCLSSIRPSVRSSVHLSVCLFVCLSLYVYMCVYTSLYLASSRQFYTCLTICAIFFSFVRHHQVCSTIFVIL